MARFEKTVVVGATQVAHLDRFLGHRLQKWRIAILIEGGGVTVRRAGKDLVPVHKALALRAGDVVIINDLFAQCYQALRRHASSNFCDYVLSKPAGSDAYLANFRALYTRRPHSALVPWVVKDLATLVHDIVLLGDRPIRHLIIVCHASIHGNLEIPQGRGLPSVTWDTLLAAVADKSLRIEEEDLTRLGAMFPRPEDSNRLPAPGALIIRGCNIGRVTVFLDKLREALGPLINVVVAPKFASAAEQVHAAGGGTDVFEYMQEDFFVYSDKLLGREALIKQFQEQGFGDWTGKKVSDDAWSKWIPPKNLSQRDTSIATERFDVMLPGQCKPRHIYAHYAYTVDKPILTLRADTELAEDNLKAAALEYVLREAKGNPFPRYRQWGYDSPQEMVDSFTYVLAKHKPGTDYKITATRHVYEIRVPLLDPQKKLIWNYYPRHGKPMLMIDENDERFFGSSSDIPVDYSEKI